jgi:hypothetical protein
MPAGARARPEALAFISLAVLGGGAVANQAMVFASMLSRLLLRARGATVVHESSLSLNELAAAVTPSTGGRVSSLLSKRGVAENKREAMTSLTRGRFS